MQSNEDDPLNRAQAPSTGQSRVAASSAAAAARCRRHGLGPRPREGFLTGSFVWMFVGVLLSAASAAFVMGNPASRSRSSSSGCPAHRPARAGLGHQLPHPAHLVHRGPGPLLRLRADDGPRRWASSCSPTSGTIGMSGVVSAFAGAAAIFGGAALYGVVTKRDLTSLGGILVSGNSRGFQRRRRSPLCRSR